MIREFLNEAIIIKIDITHALLKNFEEKMAGKNLLPLVFLSLTNRFGTVLLTRVVYDCIIFSPAQFPRAESDGQGRRDRKFRSQKSPFLFARRISVMYRRSMTSA